jgi:uracil-DNA glycosylase
MTMHPTWQQWLNDEKHKEYYKELTQFLKTRHEQGAIIYPPNKYWFTALEQDPNTIKVVILGQDPYHGPNQAHGLSFSVLPGIKTPPSLKNIYKELQADIPNMHVDVDSGYLKAWSEQGVMLLNTILTVEAGSPGSHKDKGWEKFTDTIIETINSKLSHVVFILWGKMAEQKKSMIDESKHCIITSPHPSPFSAHTGFFGSKPFSKANAYLLEQGKSEINWSTVS